MTTIARRTVIVLLAAVAGAGCMTGRAATPAERPALEVPAPPARVIAHVPSPDPPQPALEPVEDIPNPKPFSPTKPNKPAQRQGDPPKPETKPETPVTEPPPATAQPPVPQIRMPETADAGVVSRQIRDLVEQIRRTLGQIDRTRLSAVRQKTYDDAQGFVNQAEAALNENNLKFAKEVIDKAERLAKELQGR